MDLSHNIEIVHNSSDEISSPPQDEDKHFEKANLHLINTLDRAFRLKQNIREELEEALLHVHQDFAAIIYADICSIVSHNIDGLNVESQYISAVTNENTPTFIQKYINVGKFMEKCYEASKLPNKERKEIWNARYYQERKISSENKHNLHNLTILITQINECKRMNKLVYKLTKLTIRTKKTVLAKICKDIITSKTKTIVKKPRTFWAEVSFNNLNNYVQRALTYKILKICKKEGRSCIPKYLEDKCNENIIHMTTNPITCKQIIHDFLYSNMCSN